MLGQKKTRGRNIPHLLRQEVIQDYLSGRKSSFMLSLEHNIDQNNIRKMVHRYKQKNTVTFEDQLPQPVMDRKKTSTPSDNLKIKQENEDLKRQLKLVRLKLEGYRIMGDILEKEYGIDLLKKSEARQSSDSKSDTQK